jgi:hypothetical protein
MDSSLDPVDDDSVDILLLSTIFWGNFLFWAWKRVLRGLLCGFYVNCQQLIPMISYSFIIIGENTTSHYILKLVVEKTPLLLLLILLLLPLLLLLNYHLA